MKVDQLEGPLLYYWHAKALGLEVKLESYMTKPPRPAACWLVINGRCDFASGRYQPPGDAAALRAVVAATFGARVPNPS